MSDRNLTRTKGQVSVADRGRALGQTGAVVWLTGLSGSGKSTVAYAVEEALLAAKHHGFVLDGDNIRHGLCADLGFSAADRAENIRRVGRVAALFADSGLIVVCAFISPYTAGREAAREAAGSERFFEIFLDVGVEVCERRDPKGLYEKARRGEIADFTGIDAPYEKPTAPSLALDTDTLSVNECAASVIDLLRSHKILSAPS